MSWLSCICLFALACALRVTVAGTLIAKTTQTKTYVLVGATGSGKSTLGNCLLNNNADLHYLESHPLRASGGAERCTHSFETASNADVTVVDTLGYGDDVTLDHRYAQQFADALTTVDNRVDALIFVVRAGRISRATAQFFDWLHSDVLATMRGDNGDDDASSVISNSLLVITDAPTGWLAQNSRASHFLNRTLARCGQRYTEFALRMTHPSDR